MKNKKRIILIGIIGFLVAIISIGNIFGSDILMLNNNQLDKETKQLMKKKLNTMQIKNIVFSNEDLTNFKEQITFDNFEYNNLEYYKYFNEISQSSNQIVVDKANQYSKEKVTLEMIKKYNSDEKNLAAFKIGLEKGVYGEPNAIVVVNPENSLAIANKYRFIYNYIPLQLVKVENVPKLDDEEYLLTNETAKALTNMCQAIEKANGIECGGLVLTSAYRSYNAQKYLYKSIVSKDKTQQSFVNRAGNSEHQLGNTLDIMTSNVTQEEYYKTIQYRWIRQNAADYGFIIRYPENKENITQVSFEPWHLRYVGVDLAQKLSTSDLTLEEYYDELYK